MINFKLGGFIFLLMFSNSLICQSLSKFNFVNPISSIKLDKNLKEISGLTLIDGERLFAHDDEEGIIYELNPDDGEIIKHFQIGDKKIKDDFEDLTFVTGKFYLLNSSGDLLVFKEDKNNEEVEFEKIDTGLKSKYDTEGLCFDADNNSLLIASKESSKKNNEKLVFQFDLNKMKLLQKPFLKIDLSKIIKGKKKEEFKPSAIVKNNSTGTYYILGGKKLCIIEVDKNSNIIDQIELDDKFHNQPEGMVITKKDNLLISDEAEKKHARLTSYKMK